MDDVDQYRKHYLNHEASVKSIGVLYLLGAIIVVPIGLFKVISAIAGVGQAPGERGVIAGVGTFYLSLGLCQGFVGYGLRKLKGWARIGGTIFSVFGLIFIPIGTLISAYFLYLLLSEKGKIVFSDNYKQVIAQTPHIKYKTSVIVWILLGLLVGLIFFGVVFAVVAGFRGR